MNSQQETILIVDDEEVNISLLNEMLGYEGYLVQAFSDGSQALKAVKRIMPDLILLDVTMPGMNGYEVCGHLKSDNAVKDIPVLFISASSDAADKVKAFEAGGIDYVTKPFQFEEVIARVKTHIALKNARDQLESQNAVLEKKVMERTAEITKKNKELERSLEEKEVLLLEVHHRVGNNLQLISSLLSLQLDMVEGRYGDGPFLEYKNRIESINLVHQELYNSSNFLDVDMVAFIKKLMYYITNTLFVPLDKHNIHIESNYFPININLAIPLGIIMNELLCAIFRNISSEGFEVSVDLSGNSAEYVIHITTPLPGETDQKSFILLSSFSSNIVNVILEELSGEMKIQMKEKMIVTVRFSKSLPETYRDISKMLTDV